MTLKEIKEWHADERRIYGDSVRTRIDWLIAEVERQALIISGKTFHDSEKATAQACVEIVSQHFRYGDDWGNVEAAIRKKYNLEK